MENFRDTFRDMTPEIPRPGSMARAMLDAWVKGAC